MILTMKNLLYHIITIILKLLFRNKRKTLLLNIILDDDEKAILTLKTEGYFKDIGWFQSFHMNQPVNNSNMPIPWITYPAIDFIDSRLNKNMDLFEFGGGNSTLYFSKKVNYVTTVENDPDWYNKIRTHVPNNVNIIYEKLIYNGNYCKTAMNSKKMYDIIIIDGRDRVNCIINSINSLKENGVIILDDSQREEYCAGREFLQEKHFRHIDFWGISPGYLNRYSTTIFYRDGNCLGL